MPDRESSIRLASGILRIEFERFEDARNRNDRLVAQAAVGSLLQALGVLDAAYGHANAGVLAGHRHAWNVFKHSINDAKTIDYLVEITEGFQFPVQFPLGFFEIRWRQRSDMPFAKAGGGPAYDSHLAGQPVRLTVLAARDAIRARAARCGELCLLDLPGQPTVEQLPDAATEGADGY